MQHFTFVIWMLFYYPLFHLSMYLFYKTPSSAEYAENLGARFLNGVIALILYFGIGFLLWKNA